MSTVQIQLRPVETRDLGVFYTHLQHPPAQQMAAFIHENPADRAAHDAHWAKLLARDSILKRSIDLLHEDAEPELVGHIISFDMEGDRELTYWIDHHHWGKGIATKALGQFCNIEKTRPMYGRAAKDNPASIKVMTANGFALLREERGYANARGAEIDEVVMVRKS